MRKLFLLSSLVASISLSLSSVCHEAIAVEDAPPHLMIFAAASLTQVLPQVAAAWKSSNPGDAVDFSFESSSKLARQIEGGAEADGFFSADEDWMDELQAKGELEPGTRSNLLGNRLAFIVPRDSQIAALGPKDLDSAAFTHLALAGETVPAGKYGRASLRSAGILDEVKGRIVNADNVRVALEWVARKEAEGGIVYESDAMSEPRVKIAFVFDAKSHPPIVYPAAVLRRSKHAKAAKKFLDFCKSAAAASLFKAAGFLPIK